MKKIFLATAICIGVISPAIAYQETIYDSFTVDPGSLFNSHSVEIRQDNKGNYYVASEDEVNTIAHMWNEFNKGNSKAYNGNYSVSGNCPIDISNHDGIYYMSGASAGCIISIANRMGLPK